MKRSRRFLCTILTALAVMSGLLVARLGARAPELPGVVSFEPSELAVTGTGEHHRLAIPGWTYQAGHGDPLLPVRALAVKLPAGMRPARLVVDDADRVVLPGPYRPLPSFSAGPSGERVRREGVAYGGEPQGATYARELPEEILELAGVASWNGESYAQLVYHGVRWEAATGALLLYPRVSYHLELEASGSGVPLPEARRAAAVPEASPGDGALAAVAVDAGRAASLPAGGGEAIAFHPGQYPALDGSLVEYVIVTTDELAPSFQRLADFRTQLGTPAVVRTVSQIEAGYPGGTDLPDKIRLFLRDAYTHWGTRWVLLGGDNHLVPPRFAYIYYWFYPAGAWISTDLYYSTLDRNWDHDGDGILGEGFVNGFIQGDWVDLYPEVWVGRAPVETPAETDVFINKTIAYQRNISSAHLKKALFCAEVVFPQGWTPGNPIDMNGCDLAHDFAQFLPAGWDTTYLCQWPNQNETLTAVVNAINSGHHFVSVVGHGEGFRWSTGDGKFFAMDNASAASNANKYSIFFYANCNTNQTDLECLNEALMLNPNGGAVASVATTDFDFPDVGRYYEEEFFRLFSQTSTRTLGALQALMKVPFAPLSERDNSQRWTHLVYNLLGDPALPVWKTAPTFIQVSDTGTMALGDSTYTLTVRRTIGLQPVADAEVTLWKPDTGEYARGRTNGSGTVTLPFHPGTLGAAKIGVVHANHYAIQDSLQVVAGQPVVYVEAVSVDDDADGGTAGNGNGVLEAGERVEIAVTLRNGGAAPTDSVTGALALLPGSRIGFDITVDGSIHAPGRVMLGQQRTHPAALPFELDLGQAADALGRPPYTAEALGDTAADPQDSSAVDLAARAYLWEDRAGWHLRAAGANQVHTFSGALWSDGGLRSLTPYRLEAADAFTPSGDSVTFSFAVDASEAEDGLDLVLADSAHVIVLTDSVAYGVIPPGGAVARNFLLEIAADAPDGRRVRLDLTAASPSLTRDLALALDLRAPVLEHVSHAVVDTAGGDGDGVAEPGETVSLRLPVLNRGAGAAPGVTAVVRALSGATMLDSVSLYGEVPPATEAPAGSPPARFSVSSSVVELEAEFVTSLGQSWTETFTLGQGAAPSVPAGLVSTRTAETIALRWNRVTSPDLRGYHVYQGSGAAAARVNPRLVEGTARFVVEGLAPETSYVFRVSAVDSAGNESALSLAHTTKTAAPYQAGFPVVGRGRVWASPLVADLDLDRASDVAVGTRDSKVFAWRGTGSLLSGWPKSCGNLVDASPAAGDLDGDGDLEVLAGSDDAKLYAWRHDGSGYLAPSGIFASATARIRSAPTLADLDNDGSPEIIHGSDNGRIYAWRANGTGYLAPDGLFAAITGAILSSPSAADVDGDGFPEIFVTSFQGGVYAWNHDGTTFRLAGGLFRYIGGGDMWGSPAIGDVDGNGSLEIVVSAGNDSVYVFKTNATQLAGWPKKTTRKKLASPALGDLDNDGKLEVVVGDYASKLYAWRYTGAAVAGFPVTLPDSIMSSAAIGDITGDAFPEIVVGCADKNIYAYTGSGTLVPGWPVATLDRVYTSPALGDLDNDGDVEVVCGSFDGFLYAWDLGVPYNPSTMDWPMYCHDRLRTGYAAWTDPLVTDVPGGGVAPGPAPATALAMPQPNPTREGARVSFQLRHDGPVSLALYDVAGRRVRTLASGPRAAGRHELQWDGRDGAGHLASPGVYFVRMEAAGATFTRKLLIAR